jgi:hypothetical protein
MGDVFNRYGFPGQGGVYAGPGSSASHYPPPPGLEPRRISGGGEPSVPSVIGSTQYPHVPTDMTPTHRHDHPAWTAPQHVNIDDTIIKQNHLSPLDNFQLHLPQPRNVPSHPNLAIHPLNHSRRSTITDDGDHTGTGTGSNTGGTGTAAHSEYDQSRPTTGDRDAYDGVRMKMEVGEEGEERLKAIGEVDGEDGEGVKMDHRKRKRNRTIRSCVPCHNHKRKVSAAHVTGFRADVDQCDRKRPCGRCTALGLTGTCVYEVDEARDM